MKITPNNNEIRILSRLLSHADAAARPDEGVTGVEWFAQQVVDGNRVHFLGSLLPELAHDINNPNGCIRGAVDLLGLLLKDMWSVLDEHRRGHADFTLGGMPYDSVRSDLPHLLSDMRDSSQRITTAVSKLRDFSRQAAEELDEEVDVNRAIASAVELLSDTLRKCTDRFECTVEADLPTLRGNPQHLVHAVVCLLANACEALAERSQGIRIATRHDVERRSIRMDIEDEGCGMAPEVLALAGTPLFTTRHAQGKLGLGLSAASLLISRFGGTLNVNSATDRGTRVRVTFPVPSWNPLQTESADEATAGQSAFEDRRINPQSNAIPEY
ncbi:MAG: HAMP domain-containing sensor histidine kinase [FCB group bacterium]|jgi:signal transduction histidine kinase|nr:HAMP domain-containing sensor histidine kinase [FCB group bacterium]